MVAVDSEEEASEAVVAVATEAAEAAEEASVIEEAVVDQEVHQDHPYLSDKDRSNAYEEVCRDRLPEIYEKGKDN